MQLPRLALCVPGCAGYRIPASQLATPSHVEVQIVFKGQMPEGHIQWDNNEGNNWQVRVLIQLGIALSAACMNCRQAFGRCGTALPTSRPPGVKAAKQQGTLVHGRG